MNREARSLASHGRYGDDTLLHVNRRELEGIEKIVGRPVTYNPRTGLPEAFTWMDAIPIVAGIAATAATGGTAAPALYGALAAGAARTAVSSAQGKDIQGALVDGLVSGATSYATAGLAQGIGDIGAAAATPEIASAAPGVDPGIAPSGDPLPPTPLANPPDPVAPTQLAPGQTPSQLPEGQFADVRGAQIDPSRPVAVNQQMIDAAANYQQPTMMERVGTNIAEAPGRFGTTASNIGTAVTQNPDAVVGYLGRNLPQVGIAAGGTYAQMSGMLDQPQRPTTPPTTPFNARIALGPQTRQSAMPGPDYQPGYDPEFRYFARGGLADMPMRNLPSYNDALGRAEEARTIMSGGTPGRVRGAGGGLDDLVPGTIEGRQGVRLADGEFVVPSDVVSGLGDGSTDQGARKLHGMMDRVRSERTGKRSQPRKVSRNAMPA